MFNAIHSRKRNTLISLTIPILLGHPLTPHTHADINATGDITPTYDGTDPWSPTSHPIRIGRNAPGSLELDNGSQISNSSISLGTLPGSFGLLTLSDPNTELNHIGTLTVGEYGSASLHVSNGAHINCYDARIGESDTELGTAVISNPGSTWNIQSNLSIGSGSLTTQDFAQVNVGQDTALRIIPNRYPSSDDDIGQIYLNVATLNTHGLIASLDDIRGYGTINTHTLVADIDLTFDNTHPLIQTLHLNNHPDQNITLNINAANPFNRGTLGAGFDGHGSLTIADGRNVTSYNGLLADRTDATADAHITGQNTTWNITNDLNVGRKGAATLNISDHATLNVNESFHINERSTVNQNGANVNTNSGRLQLRGTYNLNAGTLDMTRQSTFGYASIHGHDTGRFNFTGGTLTNVRSITLPNGFTQAGGRFQPGDPTHKSTHIKSGYHITSPLATLEIDIADPATRLSFPSGALDHHRFDQLLVSGDVTLNGNLELNFPTQYTPELGIAFDIIRADTITGQFNDSSFQHPVFSHAALALSPIDTDNDLTPDTLRLVSTYTGDIDTNGSVNPNDLAILTLNYNTTNATWQSGDLNNDGLVNNADLALLTINWNNNIPTGITLAKHYAPSLSTGGGIPEPASLALLTLAALPLLRRRR